MFRHRHPVGIGQSLRGKAPTGNSPQREMKHATYFVIQRNHHTVMGNEDDPKDHAAVASSIFIAVAVYGGFLVFCGIQGLLHVRASRRGAISLR